MFLSDRHELRRTVDLTRRGVDDVPHPEITGRLNDVECPFYVRFQIRVRRLVRVRYSYECCQVQDGVTAIHRSPNADGITDIAAEHIEFVCHLAGVKPPP